MHVVMTGFFSLSIMFSRVSCYSVQYFISFYFCEYSMMGPPDFIYPFICHLMEIFYLPLLAVVNHAVVNIHAQFVV